MIDCPSSQMSIRAYVRECVRTSVHKSFFDLMKFGTYVEVDE